IWVYFKEKVCRDGLDADSGVCGVDNVICSAARQGCSLEKKEGLVWVADSGVGHVKCGVRNCQLTCETITHKNFVVSMLYNYITTDTCRIFREKGSILIYLYSIICAHSHLEFQRFSSH